MITIEKARQLFTDVEFSERKMYSDQTGAFIYYEALDKVTTQIIGNDSLDTVCIRLWENRSKLLKSL